MSARPLPHPNLLMLHDVWVALPDAERREERVGEAVVRWWDVPDGGGPVLVRLWDPPPGEARLSKAQVMLLQRRVLVAVRLAR